MENNKTETGAIYWPWTEKLDVSGTCSFGLKSILYVMFAEILDTLNWKTVSVKEYSNFMKCILCCCK